MTETTAKILWTKTSNVAQYKGADWENEVDRLHNVTLEQAQEHAEKNPQVTYFFYMRSSMFLEGKPEPDGWTEKGQFDAGAAVFFSGAPWYGSAPQADAYEKCFIDIDYPGDGGTSGARPSRKIELYQGDLRVTLAGSEKVDFLVVSAFPDDYEATPNTLIEALSRRHISVDQLSRDKAADYRPTLPCWVSKPTLDGQGPRLLVYEPQPGDASLWLVENIYRALQCYCQKHGLQAITVAMPLVSTGDAGADHEIISRMLINKALHYGGLKNFPLDTIKLFNYRPTWQSDVVSIFNAIKTRYAGLGLDSDTTRDQMLGLPGLHPKHAKEARSVINCLNSDARTIDAACSDLINRAGQDGEKKVREHIESYKKYKKYLTQKQAFAISLYTTEYYGTINSPLYIDPKTNMRPDLTDDKFIKLQPYYALLDAALDNLVEAQRNEPKDGALYRGVKSWIPRGTIAQHESVKKQVYHYFYTSSSLDAAIACKTFADEHGYFLTIEKHSRDVKVDVFSYYPAEEERLFKREVTFLTNKITKPYTCLYEEGRRGLMEEFFVTESAPNYCQ